MKKLILPLLLLFGASSSYADNGPVDLQGGTVSPQSTLIISLNALTVNVAYKVKCVIYNPSYQNDAVNIAPDFYNGWGI